ncbi:MAG: hypothetical protein C4525_01210 [Desulfarculus sp.]|nr:MAG: hypothetical protein C4525_01210 [Desulfarculus sp.]
MEDKRNLHLKVQEHIDCLATTDYLEEMSKLAADPDKPDAALRWLALAALHAVNAGAKKISLWQAPDGKVSVQAKYRAASLPTPGEEVGAQVLAALRGITHLEGDKVKGPLALGLRNDSLTVQVEFEKDKGGQLVTLKFPE